MGCVEEPLGFAADAWWLAAAGRAGAGGRPEAVAPAIGRGQRAGWHGEVAQPHALGQEPAPCSPLEQRDAAERQQDQRTQGGCLRP